MTNIWGFLLQTLQVCITATLLLFIKKLLTDKLPPVWHYSIWSVLGLCLLVPAGYMGRYILRTPAIYLHAVKTLAESKLGSAYTAANAPVYNSSILPVINGRPASITDMLFIIYVTGIVLCMFKYVIGYINLGRVIAKAESDSNMQTLTDATAARYGLKSCKVKVACGLPSAFVFGIFKPVLILPADKQTDGKVILHELLHLKYFDLQQKVIWSFFRALHWPNPFMQYIFNYINNDIESLCDNRVLHRLDGEERRDYGRILLDMTNEKYPSAFGTTSISNGTNFIRHRIKAITLFKKYPQGMNLVAVCITLLFIPVAFSGEKSPHRMENMNLRLTGFRKQLQLEEYRLTNCQTIAGALDVYGKSIIFDNEEIRLAVQPVGIKLNSYRLPDISKIHFLSGYPRYNITNLKQIDENNYSAYIMLKGTVSDRVKSTEYYLIPVNITKQNGSWKVYRTADYKKTVYTGSFGSDLGPPLSLDYDGGTQYIYPTPYGDVRILLDNITFFEGALNGYRYPHTDFDIIRSHNYVDFIPNEKLENYKYVGISVAVLSDTNRDFYTTELEEKIRTDNLSFTYRRGDSSYSNYLSRNILEDRGGMLNAELVNNNGDFSQPKAYQIDIFADGEKIIHFKIDTESGEMFDTAFA